MEIKTDIKEAIAKTDPSIGDVIKLINESLEETFYKGKINLFGEAVKDLLLGRKPSVLDFVIEGAATPQFVAKKIQKNLKDKVNVTLFYDSEGMFTTMRFKDVYENEITFQRAMSTSGSSYVGTGTVKTDFRNRSFTIDGLYYNILTDTLEDPSLLGVKDLSDGIIRAMKNEELVIKENPISIMRALRMTGDDYFCIEKNLWFAMLKNNNLISQISLEDIQTELTAILLSKKPSAALRRMFSVGVMKQIIPDVYNLKNEYENKTEDFTSLEHTFEMVDFVSPKLEPRLAALFHDIGCVLTKAFDQDDYSGEAALTDITELGYDTSTADNVATAIIGHRFFRSIPNNGKPSKKNVKKFLMLFGECYALTLELMNAENTLTRSGKQKPNQVLTIISECQKVIQEMKDEKAKKERPKMPVTGNDIMHYLSIKKGPEIGYLLKALDKCYEEDTTLTKGELLRKAEMIFKKAYII